jgi:hypothetical protein
MMVNWDVGLFLIQYERDAITRGAYENQQRTLTGLKIARPYYDFYKLLQLSVNEKKWFSRYLYILAFFMAYISPLDFCLTCGFHFVLFSLPRRKIRLIEINAKCRYLTKLTFKGRCFICEAPSLPSYDPHTPPPLTQLGGGGGGG